MNESHTQENSTEEIANTDILSEPTHTDIEITNKLEEALVNARNVRDLRGILDHNLGNMPGATHTEILGKLGIMQIPAVNLYAITEALGYGSDLDENLLAVLDTYRHELPEFVSAVERIREAKLHNATV